MFPILNCGTIGIPVLLAIAFGITELPVSGGTIPSNEMCVNVSSEIICYFKGSDESMAWNESWQLCSSFNATLPVIRNKNDQDQVAKHIRSHFKNSGEAWTAGKRFTYSNWTWIDGAELDESFQDAVQSREDGERDYAAVDSDFNFTALAASEELPYICQYQGAYCNSSGEITVTGRCLRFINDNRTWYDARNQCLLNKGDLAIIREDDRGRLKTMTLKQRYWIGLRKSSFRWMRTDHVKSNDEIKNVNVQYVKSGECITFDASGGKWTAVECTIRRGVVCQRSQDVTSLSETAYSSIETTHFIPVSKEITIDRSNSFTPQSLMLAAVIAVLAIIICIIVIIAFVQRIKKRSTHQSKRNECSEQNNHEALYNRISYSAVNTFANESANAFIDRSDTGVEYAEIAMLTPEELEAEGTNQSPGISYTSLAANEQMEDGGTNQEPRAGYVSLASEADPEYMEVVQNHACSTAPSKVGPLGDMYAMPGCKDQAVTSPCIESASQSVKVIPKGETVYANL